MKYILDANIFINAHRDMYQPAFAPGYWDLLSEAHDRDLITSIPSVRDELTDVDLAAWAKRSPLFDHQEETDHHAQLEWIKDQKRFSSAGHVHTYMSGADPFLVATARKYGYTVVTAERGSPQGARVAIPNVCDGLGVPCMLPSEFHLALNRQLVLRPESHPTPHR